MMFFYIVLGFTWNFRASQSANTLDCFSCSNLTVIEDCHTTTQCLPDQFCYTESYTGNLGEERFNLGCRGKELCRNIDQTGLFVGKRQEKQCQQCCSLHGCNKYLCPIKFTAAPASVDGQWSLWQSWESCMPSCGIGLKFRHRSCDNPSPSHNGRLCLGDAKDVALCNTACSSDSPGTDVPVTPSTTTPTTTPSTTPTTTTASKFVTNDFTQAPGQCKDLIDCTGYYRPEACNGIYKPWANRYCPVHCGFCKDVSPEPCVDAIPNCGEYQADICSKRDFFQWREINCRKYCFLC